MGDRSDHFPFVIEAKDRVQLSTGRFPTTATDAASQQELPMTNEKCPMTNGKWFPSLSPLPPSAAPPHLPLRHPALHPAEAPAVPSHAVD